MPYNPDDYQHLVDKRITIVYNLDTPDENGITAVEVEATLMAAAKMGVMIRQRGRQQGELIDASAIERIDQAAMAPRKIKQKLLKAVDLDDARAHLADRHGYTMTAANNLSAKGALELHDTFDHSDLGHTHEAANAGRQIEA